MNANPLKEPSAAQLLLLGPRLIVIVTVFVFINRAQSISECDLPRLFMGDDVTIVCMCVGYSSFYSI